MNALRESEPVWAADRWAELKAHLSKSGFTQDGRSYYEWMAGAPPIRPGQPRQP